MVDGRNLWLKKLLFTVWIFLILFSNSFAREDRLLFTERTFWRPVDSYIRVENLKGRSLRSERVNGSKITLSSSHSAIISSRNGDLLRFRAEAGSIKNIEIFRISGYGQSLVKTLPKEIELSDKSILISPPSWIPDPSYQFQIRSNKPEDSLTLIGEYLDRDFYRFYFDDVEQEARRDISKGLWQSRAGELWRSLEPGDRVREFYRRQLAVIPWLQDKNSPDYELSYRNARLGLDLLEFSRFTRLDYRSVLVKSSTPVSEELNIDDRNYQLESRFSFEIEGPVLIEVATRLPYVQTPLHEVKTYSMDLHLNGRFFDRLFVDTRLDDLCSLVLDKSNRPLGRLRTQSILIPSGFHKLQIEASEQLYLSITLNQRRRAYLKDVFRSRQEIEVFLKKAVEEADLMLLQSPKDHRAAYIRAAALIDLGRSGDAVEPLRQLLKEVTDPLLKASVELLIARSISETKAFESALKVFTPDLDVLSLNKDNALPALHRRAISIEIALEEARLLRLLGNHLLAAERLEKAIPLDPYGTLLYEEKADALKWSSNLHSVNPEFIDLYDRALKLSPSDSKLLTARRRAWGDFTYWQTLQPERTNGENGLAGFDCQPDRMEVEDFRGDLPLLECDAQARLIDYARRSLYFYRLPLGFEFR
ncbi:MAG: hypothetical protein QW303_08915, partial [Nitrososphaerota archaeon]